MLSFWVENVILMFMYLMLELIAMPVAFLRIWVNLFKSARSVLQIIVNYCLFALIAPVIMPSLVVYDCINFLRLLLYYEGCRVGKIDELA